MNKADPHFPRERHPAVETIDRWCCGLLNAVEARKLERHLRGCAHCQRVSQFGPRLTAQLRAMPTASRVERLRHPARVRRFAVAAIAGSALLLTVVVALPLWTRRLTPPDLKLPGLRDRSGWFAILNFTRGLRGIRD